MAPAILQQPEPSGEPAPTFVLQESPASTEDGPAAETGIASAQHRLPSFPAAGQLPVQGRPAQADMPRMSPSPAGVHAESSTPTDIPAIARATHGSNGKPAVLAQAGADGSAGEGAAQEPGSQFFLIEDAKAAADGDQLIEQRLLSARTSSSTRDANVASSLTCKAQHQLDAVTSSTDADVAGSVVLLEGNSLLGLDSYADSESDTEN